MRSFGGITQFWGSAWKWLAATPSFESSTGWCLITQGHAKLPWHMHAGGLRRTSKLCVRVVDQVLQGVREYEAAWPGPFEVVVREVQNRKLGRQLPVLHTKELHSSPGAAYLEDTQNLLCQTKLQVQACSFLGVRRSVDDVAAPPVYPRVQHASAAYLWDIALQCVVLQAQGTQGLAAKARMAKYFWPINNTKYECRNRLHSANRTGRQCYVLGDSPNPERLCRKKPGRRAVYDDRPKHPLRSFEGSELTQ